MRHAPTISTLFPYTTLFRSAIQTLRNGQCVLSDLDGRTEVVQIDPITDDLRAAFDTTPDGTQAGAAQDRKSTRLNSSHVSISYAVFCLKKKNIIRCQQSSEV